jgi:hypothetical protein
VGSHAKNIFASQRDASILLPEEHPMVSIANFDATLSQWPSPSVWGRVQKQTKVRSFSGVQILRSTEESQIRIKLPRGTTRQPFALIGKRKDLLAPRQRGTQTPHQDGSPQWQGDYSDTMNAISPVVLDDFPDSLSCADYGMIQANAQELSPERLDSQTMPAAPPPPSIHCEA